MRRLTRSHGRIQPRVTSTPRPVLGGDEARPRAWRAQVLTLFPEAFPGPLGLSLTGKALREGLWALETLDIRRFATDKHRSVDGPPAGGGAGMVLRADVTAAALDTALDGGSTDRARRPVVCLSPRGRRFDQATARSWASGEGVILLCGRFEGVDQRVLEARGVEEVSVGDYVLTGGEIAAMTAIDATVRLLPGVLGNAESIVDESFSAGLLEAPHYTRPRVWEGRPIPEVLLSGHHADIAAWRASEARMLTQDRRPDLLGGHGAQDAPGRPPEAEERSDAPTSAGKAREEQD